MTRAATASPQLLPEHRLPALFLARYFFFLGRRPISKSNAHYLNKRLAGLKALGKMLEDEPSPALQKVLARLRRLAAINFQRLYPAIFTELKSLMRDEAPTDVVVSSQPPPTDFLRGVRKVLLILGPAIGVGDEIITFSIPGWLQRALPGVEISVLSAYGGLWDRVAGVRRNRAYELYPEVIEAIRGQGPDGETDLVLLVDFESPALFPAVCDEPGVARYVEVSMASRSIVAFDGERRWLHPFEHTGPYFENHYENLASLMSWLGLPATLEGRRTAILDQRPERGSEERVVLVSPFSSKHDPVEDYWSRLLAAIVSPEQASATRFVFDTGPNLATESFARGLARATEGRAPGVRCELARVAGRRILSLQDMFRHMEKADALICVDSFAAHAGPLFGCTTFVLAAKKLESWRVPEAQSYYFDAAAPLAGIVAGIRQVLAVDDGGASWLGENDAERLLATTDRLMKTLDETMPIDELCVAYEALRDVGSRLFDQLQSRSESIEPIFADRVYSQLLPPPPHSRRIDGERAADLRAHLRDKLARWRNTNLCKLLERLTGRAGAKSHAVEPAEAATVEVAGAEGAR